MHEFFLSLIHLLVYTFSIALHVKTSLQVSNTFPLQFFDDVDFLKNVVQVQCRWHAYKGHSVS